MRVPIFSLFFALLAPGVAGAQGGTPFLVKDFNTQRLVDRTGSGPDFWCRLSGKVLFSATTFEKGEELFVTGGTAATTSMVADLRLGAKGSDPVFLGKIGKVAIFAANDGSHGKEIWVSDGTALGTHLLAETQAGAGSLFYAPLGQVKGLVFFSTRGPGGSRGLWRTDGTTKGTMRLLGIQSQGTNLEASIFAPVAVQAGILVIGNNAQDTRFFLTKGTPQGTRTFFNLPNQIVDSIASNGSLALFRAKDSKHGWEPWRSDGTVKGTGLLRDLIPGTSSSRPSQFKSWQGRILFLAKAPDISTNGPWISDGSPQGTKFLGPSGISRIDTGGKIAVFSPGYFQRNHRLWFLTPGGSPKPVLLIGDPSFFTPTPIPGGFLVTTRSPFNLTFQTWKVDPKTGKGQVIAPQGFLPKGRGFFDGTLAFQGMADPKEGLSGDGEPYILDGSLKGTRLLKNLYVFPGTASSISLASFPSGRKNLILAHPKSSQKSSGLWEWEGLPPSPLLLRRLVIPPFAPKVSGDLLRTPDLSFGFFRAGQELYKLDAGLRSNLPLISGDFVTKLPGRGSPAALLGQKLLFSYSGGTPIGREPFLSDGTLKGTGLLKDLVPGRGSSLPFFFRRIGNLVFFSASDSKGMRRPWRTDGTVQGTQALTFANPKLTCQDPNGFRRWDNRIWFPARDPKTGTFFPYFSGAKGAKVQGRVQDKAFAKGFRTLEILGAGPKRLVFSGRFPHVGARNYFSIKRVANGYKVLNLGAFTGSQVILQTAPPFRGDFLFFGLLYPNREVRIWRGDGTQQGTKLVFKSGFQGSCNSCPKTWVLGNRRVLFGLRNSLWQTDGSAKGTVPIHRAGLFYNPESLFLANGFLHFNALDSLHGKEAWAWFPGAHGNPWGQGCGGSPIQNPSLVAEDPVLGQSFTIKGEGAAANAPGVLLLGVAGSPSLVLPSQTSIPCRLYLDFRTFWIPLQPFLSSATGSWAQRYTAPTDQSLQGTTFVLQALFPKSSQGRTLFEASNGYQATLGR